MNAGHGFVYCLDAKTGERIWRFASHGKFASTPTIAGDRVYLTSFAGRLIVLDKHTGKFKWQFRGCTTTESSPLVWRGRIFFGDRNGDLWALSMRTHKVVWKYHCAGKVTGAPAMLNERIVVGDYAGYVYCFNYDGGVIWKRQGRQLAGDQPLLRHAGARLQHRLHRLDQQQRLRPRPLQRRHALAGRHRRLGLLVAGGLAGTRLHRQLRHLLLLLRRAHRPRDLALPRRTARSRARRRCSTGSSTSRPSSG